jgi:hypothetical protein
MNEHETSKTQEAVKSTEEHNIALPLIVAVVSGLVFLNAHFFLRSWAMASMVNHTIDHIIIFLSGSTFGAALFNMLRSRSK